MAKHIGIVAVSAEGAALCYRTICIEGASLLGPHNHPEITMHTYPLAEYMGYIETAQWDEVGRLLLASAERVRKAGADFLVCPDNTVHQAIDVIRDQSPLPWLHIAEAVTTAASQNGFKRVLLLGTRYLMEGPVYPSKLSAKGIHHEIPEAPDRERINQLIFDELVWGRFTEAARAYFREIIEEFKGRGCDAAVFGCTEIPLLISDTDSPLPVLDSTRLLARAALREATLVTNAPNK